MERYTMLFGTKEVKGLDKPVEEIAVGPFKIKVVEADKNNIYYKMIIEWESNK